MAKNKFAWKRDIYTNKKNRISLVLIPEDATEDDIHKPWNFPVTELLRIEYDATDTPYLKLTDEFADLVIQGLNTIITFHENEE